MAVRLTRENEALHGALSADALRSAVRRLSGGFPRQVNDPVLRFVRLEADNEGFRLTGSDGQAVLEAVVPGEVIGRGVALIPYGLLKQVLTGAKGKVRVYGDRGMVMLQAGQRIVGLPTADPATYPAPPTWPELSTTEVNLGQLRFALRRVLFAASKDRARPLLMSVRVRTADRRLEVVATDACRLSAAVVEAAVEAPFEAVVASGAVDALLRLMPSDGMARLGVSDETFYTVGADPRGGRFRFATRLVVEGKYPEIDAILRGPEEDWAVWAFDRDELAGAVRSAARLDAPIVFDLGRERAHVSASMPDLGSVESDLRPIRFGRPIRVGFDPKKLADLMPYLIGPTVVAAFKGPLERSIWRDPDDPTFAHVLMPMRLPAA